MGNFCPSFAGWWGREGLAGVPRGTDAVSQEPNFWTLVLNSGCSTQAYLLKLTMSLSELLFPLTFLLVCMKAFPLARDRSGSGGDWAESGASVLLPCLLLLPDMT